MVTGSGKTTISRRLPGILPTLTFDEALETTMVYSVAGLLGQRALIRERPFRAPHHTVSVAGLAGGGPTVRPGEISLAHNGVLFLDELLEFSRPVLETLRQPLEERSIAMCAPGGRCAHSVQGGFRQTHCRLDARGRHAGHAPRGAAQ